ncbi:MAG: hypothetical protein M3Y80_00960, partial [Verrucomicrobiota bacterium]|nr:hypothetical protein [Verrucomicrobiota bacterium]
MPASFSAFTSVSAVKESDIVFECDHCGASLVVDGAAAGLAVQCQSCARSTGVPCVTAPEEPANGAKLSDLQHQLTENQSQRTEVTGYINQLSIQLHRWQLRLKTLNERQA